MVVDLEIIKEILRYSFNVGKGRILEYKYLTHSEKMIMGEQDYKNLLEYIQSEVDPIKELCEYVQADIDGDFQEVSEGGYRRLLNQIKTN